MHINLQYKKTMGKYDILFERIVTSKELADELGPDAGRYKTVADAKKAVSNKKIRAIAEIISEVGYKFDLKKSDARLYSEETTLDESEFQSIYRKIVSLLN